MYNRSNPTNGRRTNQRNDNDDLNRFIADHEARSSLLRLNDHNINIRELSSYYSTSAKPKKGKKFNYRVTVILIKSQKINNVPIPNRIE